MEELHGGADEAPEVGRKVGRVDEEHGWAGGAI